jgi:hypothetical protein
MSGRLMNKPTRIKRPRMRKIDPISMEKIRD